MSPKKFHVSALPPPPSPFYSTNIALSLLLYHHPPTLDLHTEYSEMIHSSALAKQSRREVLSGDWMHRIQCCISAAVWKWSFSKLQKIIQRYCVQERRKKEGRKSRKRKRREFKQNRKCFRRGERELNKEENERRKRSRED